MFAKQTTGALEHLEGESVSASFGDANGDGYPDLYLVKGKASANILYLNQRDGTFVALESTGLEDRGAGSKALLADFNNDGLLDCFLTTTIDGNLLFMQVPSASAAAPSFADNTTGAFGLTTNAVGAEEALDSGTTLSAAVGDVNNDGRLDIVVVNGGSDMDVIKPVVFFECKSYL